jgi:hypothetical protein
MPGWSTCISFSNWACADKAGNDNGTLVMNHKLALLLAMGCMAAWPCAAAVNKCTDAKGRVTYQDGACPVVPAPEAVALAPVASRPVTSAETADYANARGTWRGPAQLQLVVGGQRQPDAPAPMAAAVELESDGRVRGSLDGAGCKLLGVHSPSSAPSVAALDVTLAGCRDARFNARYSGQLNTSAASKEARLALQAPASSAPAGKPSQPSLEAVLRR